MINEFRVANHLTPLLESPFLRLHAKCLGTVENDWIFRIEGTVITAWVPNLEGGLRGLLRDTSLGFGDVFRGDFTHIACAFHRKFDHNNEPTDAGRIVIAFARRTDR
ncbi:MAG: hypothetical protein NVSMB9_31290 [Isosphaeraceae bacterium]